MTTILALIVPGAVVLITLFGLLARGNPKPGGVALFWRVGLVGLGLGFGAWYLAALLRKYSGNPVLALATYNAGPQAVESWVTANARRALDEFVEDIPFKETRHYVKRVVSNLAVYAWLYGGKHLDLPAEVAGTYLDNVEF